MKKHIFITVICIGMLFLSSGCGTEKPEESLAENNNISTEESSFQETVASESVPAETEASETREEEIRTPEATSEEIAVQETEGFDITAELEQTEAQAKLLKEKLQSASTQADLNVAAQEIYELWDEELNFFWQKLQDALNEEEMSALVAEEREWIAFKEAEAAAAGSEFEGGSLYALIVYQKEAELTRTRVYEVAVYLAEKSGQTLEIQAIDDHSGSYVDRQGTEDIFSELDLNLLRNGIYETTISLYRLTTLDGTAKIDGDKFIFEDTVTQIKGEITFPESGAVLTITESEFVYINPGEVFEFPEKMK